MTALDILRVAGILAWAIVALLNAGSIVRVLRGQARFYDTLWSLVSCVGFLNAGFNVRWFLGGDTMLMWQGLHVFSIMLALTIFRVTTKYEAGASQ